MPASFFICSLIRSLIHSDLFGNDLNFNVKHTEWPNEGLHEIGISRPYCMQTYMRWPNGNVYNEICEFEFDTEKTGHGYYYLINVYEE